MSKKKIIKNIALSVPIAAIGISSIGVYANNSKNNSNQLGKYAIMNNSYSSPTTYSGGQALNPDTIAFFGQSTNFTDANTSLAIFTNLEKNYKNNNKKVADFVNTYPLKDFAANYNTSKFIDRLKEIIKDINNVGNDQGLKQEFTIKTPKFVKDLSKPTSPSTPANSFYPQIAEFDINGHGTFKIDVSMDPTIAGARTGNAGNISLYIHNEDGQFGNKSITELINNKDIFIRDKDSNKPKTGKVDTTDLFYFEKKNGKIKVSLKAKPNETFNIKADSLKDSVKLKTGYLNDDPHFGVNITGLKDQKVKIFSSGLQLNDAKDPIKFTIIKDSKTHVRMPIYFKKHKNDEDIDITFKNTLIVKPKVIKVEDGIINPKKDSNFTHTKFPLTIDKTISTDKKSAWIIVNYGQDASMSRSEKKRISFEDLGVKAESKVFFERIDSTGTPDKKQTVNFTAFKDPNKLAKRILANIFSHWIEIPKYGKYPYKSSNLSFGTHKIHHTNFKKISIDEKYTNHSKLTGADIVKLIKKEEQEINEILRKTGNDKYVSKNTLFTPAGNEADVFANMEDWLYAYDDKSKEEITAFTKLIQDLQKAGDDKLVKPKNIEKMNKKAEAMLNAFVQKRENELINNFQKIILGKLYKYFGQSLSKVAEKDDKIIANDAFELFNVNINKTSKVRDVVKKKNVKLVGIKDPKAAKRPNTGNYITQVLNRIFDIVDKNHFTDLIFQNPKKFRDNKDLITDKDTYVDNSSKSKNGTTLKTTSDYSKAKESFDVLIQLMKYFNISINDLMEYSTRNAKEFNEDRMLEIIKLKMVEFQESFLNNKRSIHFFGKEFEVNKIDALVTSANTKTTLDTLSAAIQGSKDKKEIAKFKKIEKITRTNVSTDGSIDKFAVALKKYDIKDYIEYYSNNPEKHVKDIWESDIQNMDYDLDKPLTPGNFGEFLNHSKEITSSLFVMFGLVFSIIAALGLYFVKSNGTYSYNKFSIENVYNEENKRSAKKNKLIRIAFGFLMVLGVVLLTIGILTLVGVITPAIFMI